MVGTVLSFRDDGRQPCCDVALDSGDPVRLILDADGLQIARSAPADRVGEVLFRAGPSEVAAICAGVVGPKRQSGASPLRTLAAAAQRIGSAAELRSAFSEMAAGLS